jgi:hypothetical protein
MPADRRPSRKSPQGRCAPATLRSKPDELIGGGQEQLQIEDTMLYSQSPPLAEHEAAQEDSPPRFANDQEPRAEPRFGRRPMSAPIHPLPPPRPSIGRRMFRAVSRFAIVLLIGVGATLGWQAYGDMAKEMLATRAPEQAWLLSYLPATRPPAVVAANPALQLEPLAANLEFMRRSVEQLALKQEQVIRTIAALQAVDEDIRQKVSSPPAAPAPAQPAAAIPQPKPLPAKPQPTAGAPAPRPSASAGPAPLLPR